MVESDGWRNATHLARMGVFYGSLIEVSLSSMALVFVSLFFKDIEKNIELGDYAWVVMYSTLCTTSVMLASGILGLVTTWSRAKVRDSAPVVKKEAFWKATIEGGLFCYMIPFNTLVAILIFTTPGPSAWVKALKVVMSAPSLFFQFGWFMACRKFWQVIESGHGEELVMPEEPVHTFADLSEPLLPEDSSELDLSAQPFFKSASQFGPMGIPGLGLAAAEGPAAAEEEAAALLGSTTDAENPGTGPVVGPGAADQDAQEDMLPRDGAATLESIGVANSTASSSFSPRGAEAAHFNAHGDSPDGQYPPSIVSPVLSPSRLHRLAGGAGGADDSGSLASSTDISDDKENSARGPGGAAAAVTSATAAAGGGAAAEAEEAVLSPSLRTSPQLRTPPKVPPLVIPFPPPASPHRAHYASGSGYLSTPIPSTARETRGPPGTPAAAAAAATPPRPPPSAATPRTARTPGPPTTPSTSTRISTLLSGRKLMSPMRSGGGGAAGDAAALPPPSPHSDLSLSRFMHLIKNRKHASKAAQKLPQQFTGASAQFAVKPSPPRVQAGDVKAAGSAPPPRAGSGADTPGAPRTYGRGALSAEAAVLEGHREGGSPGGGEDEATSAPAGSSTAPRWDRALPDLAALNFDDSATSEDLFEDATSELAPSSSSSSTPQAAAALGRRSGSGALGSKVSNVWSKVKARTAAASRGGD